VPGHAETAGVVNDDQVSTAAFNKLRADARSRSGCDDGLSIGQCGTKAFDYFFARIGIAPSSPGIWHNLRNLRDLALFDEETQLRTGPMFVVDPNPNMSKLKKSPRNV
jgi:hypothetical protein